MLLIRRISDGEMMPWCWGVAWYDYCHRQTVLAPIPINFAIRVFWWVYWGFAVKWMPAAMVARMSELDRVNKRLRAKAALNCQHRGREAAVRLMTSAASPQPWSTT